jgi:hypothetical protein
MRFQMVSLVVLAAALSGCAVKKVPGTDIDDTSTTRDVLDVMRKYRIAFEQERTTDIVALTDESFRDNGGSADPDDDHDYARLPSKLDVLFSKVEDVRLEMSVRKVEYDEEETAVRVTYNYTLSFRTPEYAQRPHSDTDIKQMTLKRIGPNAWKITSGI